MKTITYIESIKRLLHICYVSLFHFMKKRRRNMEEAVPQFQNILSIMAMLSKSRVTSRLSKDKM